MKKIQVGDSGGSGFQWIGRKIQEARARICIRVGNTFITHRSFPFSPSPIGIDPFCPFRFRLGQRQVDDGDPLPFATPPTDSHDFSGIVQIDSVHGDLYPQQCRCERNRQVFFQHCEDASDLLGLVVAVHRGFGQSTCRDGPCWIEQLFFWNYLVSYSSGPLAY